MPVIYAELRRRAAARLRHERAGHSLHPTDLVHETYLRLCAQNPAWQNREQFFAVASHLMRRILVDHARARAAAKRGGGLRVTMPPSGGAAAAVDPSDPDLLDLGSALVELAALDPAQAREAFLETACGDDDALRREIESLLAAHVEAGHFLSEPARLDEDGPSAGTAGRPRGDAAASAGLTAGTRLGPYEIVSFLGA